MTNSKHLSGSYYTNKTKKDHKGQQFNKKKYIAIPKTVPYVPKEEKHDRRNHA